MYMHKKPNITMDDVTKAEMYRLMLRGEGKGKVIDIQGKYRRREVFQTTLGHMANHKFINHNTQYQQDINHPVLGPIGGLKAIAEIEPDEEIFAHYGYRVQHAPIWYRAEFESVYGMCQIYEKTIYK